MSYQRYGYPYKLFKGGETTEYVFITDEGVEDYDSEYGDNKSFIEVIADIIRRETNDDAFTIKIAGTLAERLGVKNDFLGRFKTADEWFDEHEEKMEGLR